MFEQGYYYCLAVRVVNNMFVQHSCVTPVRLCWTRGRERRHTESLTLCVPITMTTDKCIPRQLFVLKFNMH